MKPLTVATLVKHLSSLLSVERFQDYAPNGLQVEGNRDIQCLVTGVTACQALIDAAIEANADAVLVHHGYFWKAEDPCVSGLKRNRLATLLQQGIHLLAYHLPLDAHPVIGNNAQLAKRLGWQIEENAAVNNPKDLICYGRVVKAMSPVAFGEQLNVTLARPPLHIPGKSSQINKIAWCTGAAQDYFETAIAKGIDAFITGEVSERTWHIAREYGVHFYAAGHHATERFGVQALGEHLAQEFGVQHHFIDIPNPI